jgi:hypothetical protein
MLASYDSLAGTRDTLLCFTLAGPSCSSVSQLCAPGAGQGGALQGAGAPVLRPGNGSGGDVCRVAFLAAAGSPGSMDSAVCCPVTELGLPPPSPPPPPSVGG